LANSDHHSIPGVTFRRATPGDVPRLTDLIAAAELPPIFIAEFIDGFVVAERDGRVVACGGVEQYDGSAVIRSVVVDPAAQGLGIGARIAAMLMDAARAADARDVYLFTRDAWAFWSRLGFVEVTFEDWQEPARACWQYQFLSQNGQMAPDVHPMWRTAEP
jgi:N-acetylglutamate synthase-like GNAT family acetyltransferase